MKESVRVSLVQFASTWLQPEENATRMASFVAREASEHGAELVVFPELASTGYIEPNTDTTFAAKLYAASEYIPGGPTTAALRDVARRHNVHVIAGISERHPKLPYVLYNSAAFIGPDGELLGVQRKLHAALQEKNYYMNGHSIDVFPSRVGTIGINICYDTRFPEVARVQALRGSEIIVSIWASATRPGLLPSVGVAQAFAARAMENHVYFLSCNRSGREGDRIFTGRSAVVAPSGQMIALSDTADEDVVRAVLLDSEIRSQRTFLTIYRDRRPELYKLIGESSVE